MISVDSRFSTGAAGGRPAEDREALPVLQGRQFSLRELRLDDAPSLLATLTTDDVSRFIAPSPSSIDGFERFIEWTLSQRKSGSYACFGIVPTGHEHPIGIFQVRSLDPSFQKAEWDFAMGSAFWGSGLFADAAHLVLGFTFDALGAHRLEARAAVFNGRGNGALLKLGAVQEGVLRRSFVRNGTYHDQILWAILAGDWREQRRSATAH